ncbi:carboxylic ester hydrolase-like [Oratosquilla oratoria]|uniref:carboxylic ester hydrolase-like n=1 Tax=Oratosquilla oratoria TaxID=337810 RepID=UPI003F7592FA
MATEMTDWQKAPASEASSPEGPSPRVAGLSYHKLVTQVTTAWQRTIKGSSLVVGRSLSLESRLQQDCLHSTGLAQHQNSFFVLPSDVIPHSPAKMNAVKQCVVLVVALSLLEMVASQKGGRNNLTSVLYTAQGPIIGEQKETESGYRYYVYAGIPYAKPPVGNLRFKDPEPWENWSGLRHSLYKPTSITINNANFRAEDILYLDVYTPSHPRATSSYPVMVFFHDGTFRLWTPEYYSPRTFVERGMVFVRVDYRRRIFGFLSTEDSVIPGNFGLKDQSMALRWVQENIKYYGGDPNQVTIIGDGAGAASVMFHIVSPYSAGLFSRAIMVSGSGLAPWAMGQDFRRVATGIAQRFNCPIQSQEMLHCLQQLDTSDFADVLGPFHEFWGLPRYMRPRVDGDFLPDDPRVLLEEGNYNHVDIMSGITKDEGGSFTGFMRNEEVVFNNFTRFATYFYELTHEESDDYIVSSILEYYLGRTTVNKTDISILDRISGDVKFILPHDLHAKLFLRSSRNRPGKVFLYELSYVVNALRGRDGLPQDVDDTYVFNGDDLQFLFDFKYAPRMSPEDLQVRDVMISTFVNFAKIGNPTPTGALGYTWEPATEERLEHLVINPSPFMEEDKRAVLRRFWANLPVRDFRLFKEREIVQTKGAAY